MISNIKGLILAAGRGSRMGSLTSENPKCMVKYKGRPLIEQQISSLKEAGIHDIGIICGYKAELLAPYSQDIFINPEWEISNMVHSLLFAKEWLFNFPCVVSYSDIFYQADIIDDLKNSPAEVSISYDPDWLQLWQGRFTNPLEDAETFEIDDQGYLTENGNKTDNLENIKGQYMGLLKFSPSFWKKIEDSLPTLDLNLSLTAFLNGLIRKGIKIKTVPNKGDWGEIDSPIDLQYYESIATKV
jgi:choline kinase